MGKPTNFERVLTQDSANSSPDFDATVVQAELFGASTGAATIPSSRKLKPDRRKRRISESASTAWREAESRFMRENKNDSRRREKRIRNAGFKEGSNRQSLYEPATTLLPGGAACCSRKRRTTSSGTK